VNRDIKLENTLLTGSWQPLLKICDFGYSKHEKDSLPRSKVGTPGYQCSTNLLLAGSPPGDLQHSLQAGTYSQFSHTYFGRLVQPGLS
jgi:hypothetical protein